MGLGPDSVGVGLFRSEQGRIGDSAADGTADAPHRPRRRRTTVSGTETR